MRFFAFVALLLAALPAYAQTLTGTLTFNSSAAYQGVGDYDTNVAHFWGLSAYSHAVAVGGTQSGVDLSNNSTTCTGVKFLSTGKLDVSSGLYCNTGTQTVTAWCSTSCVYNGSAHIVTLYDQAGGGANQTSAYSGAPVFVLSGFNSSPTGQCGGGSNLGMTATITTIAPPQGLGMSFEQFANFAVGEVFASGTGGNLVLNNNSAANTISGSAAGGIANLAVTATNGTGSTDFAHGHNVVFTVNSAQTSQSIFVDGAQGSGSPATISYGGSTGTTFYLCNGAGTNYADIFFGKFWIDNAAPSTTTADNVTSQANVPLP